MLRNFRLPSIFLITPDSKPASVDLSSNIDPTHLLVPHQSAALSVNDDSDPPFDPFNDDVHTPSYIRDRSVEGKAPLKSCLKRRANVAPPHHGHRKQADSEKWPNRVPTRSSTLRRSLRKQPLRTASIYDGLESISESSSDDEPSSLREIANAIKRAHREFEMYASRFEVNSRILEEETCHPSRFDPSGICVQVVEVEDEHAQSPRRVRWSDEFGEDLSQFFEYTGSLGHWFDDAAETGEPSSEFSDDEDDYWMSYAEISIS